MDLMDLVDLLQIGKRTNSSTFLSLTFPFFPSPFLFQAHPRSSMSWQVCLPQAGVSWTRRLAEGEDGCGG